MRLDATYGLNDSSSRPTFAQTEQPIAFSCLYVGYPLAQIDDSPAQIGHFSMAADYVFGWLSPRKIFLRSGLLRFVNSSSSSGSNSSCAAIM